MVSSFNEVNSPELNSLKIEYNIFIKIVLISGNLIVSAILKFENKRKNKCNLEESFLIICENYMIIYLYKKT